MRSPVTLNGFPASVSYHIRVPFCMYFFLMAIYIPCFLGFIRREICIILNLQKTSYL